MRVVMGLVAVFVGQVMCWYNMVVMMLIMTTIWSPRNGHKQIVLSPHCLKCHPQLLSLGSIPLASSKENPVAASLT